MILGPGGGVSPGYSPASFPGRWAGTRPPFLPRQGGWECGLRGLWAQERPPPSWSFISVLLSSVSLRESGAQPWAGPQVVGLGERPTYSMSRHFNVESETSKLTSCFDTYTFTVTKLSVSKISILIGFNYYCECLGVLLMGQGDWIYNKDKYHSLIII